jgi:hypothetical protein
MDRLICPSSLCEVLLKISSTWHLQTSLLVAQLYDVISAFRQPIQQPCLSTHTKCIHEPPGTVEKASDDLCRAGIESFKGTFFVSWNLTL